METQKILHRILKKNTAFDCSLDMQMDKPVPVIYNVLIRFALQ